MRLNALVTIVAATAISAANVFAGGSADKVTGDWTQGNCWGCQPGDELGWIAHRLVSAQEETTKHPQRGFFFSWRDDGSWWEMDFNDSIHTCVQIDNDNTARIGGLISDGRNQFGEPASAIGRYFGIFLADGGEPAYFMDHGMVYRFSWDHWSDDARDQFFEWCETGNLPAEDDRLDGFVAWPNVVIRGNLKVHNSSKDGD